MSLILKALGRLTGAKDGSCPTTGLMKRIRECASVARIIPIELGPTNLTDEDYAINDAVVQRWENRARSAIAMGSAVYDQHTTGRRWHPRYPVGNIAACVMAEEIGLWEKEKSPEDTYYERYKRQVYVR